MLVKKSEYHELLRLTFGSEKNAGLRDIGNRRTDKHYGMAAFLSAVSLPLGRSSLKPAAYIYMCLHHKYLSV